MKNHIEALGTGLRSIFSFVVVILMAVSHRSMAMDSTQVLPESVNSPQVRMGFVSGIGMKFMSSGELMSLSDINSLEINAKVLSEFEPRVNQLVSVLNRLGPQKLGDELSLGVLHVDTAPEVRYVAPIYARGLLENWTVALAVPIVTYKNRLSLRQTGSNVAAVRAAAGSGSEELTAALEQFNIDVPTVVQSTLVKKGYRPLNDRNETEVGDVNLVSVFQFAKHETTSAQFKTILSLPTGHGDDPDDLADLGIFGVTSIENQLLGNFTWRGRWRLAAKGGYRYTLPDTVVRRVPLDEKDTLPGSETKESVLRATGGALFVGGSLTYVASDTLDFAVGFETTKKSSDDYRGSKGARYDLLSDETQSSADRVRMGVSYSSTETYLSGTALLPMILSYEFSDTIRGVNTERTTIHEIWLQLFF